MDILFLALITGTGFLVVIMKLLGFNRAIKWQIPIDIILTFGLPILFFGTYHGMALAACAGLVVTAELWLLSKLIDTNDHQNRKRNSYS